MAQNKIHTI